MIEKANLLRWLEALRLEMMLGTLSKFLIFSMYMRHSYIGELRGYSLNLTLILFEALSRQITNMLKKHHIPS